MFGGAEADSCLKVSLCYRPCYYDVFSLVYTRRPTLVALVYGVLYLILTCDIVFTYSRMFCTLYFGLKD